MGWKYESWRHGLAARGVQTAYYARRNRDVAAMRFDPYGLKKIGEGSDRVVFAVDKKKVLKVAKNPRGLAQNEQEGKEARLTPKVLERGEDYVVVQSDPQTQRRRVWEKIRVLRKFDERDFDERNPVLVKEMERLGIGELLEKKHVAWADVVKPSSWSMVKGRLVLVDAGALTTISTVKHGIFDRENPGKVKEWHDVIRKRERFVEAMK